MSLVWFTVGIVVGVMLMTMATLGYLMAFVRAERVRLDAAVADAERHYNASVDELRRAAGLRPIPRHEPRKEIN